VEVDKDFYRDFSEQIREEVLNQYAERIEDASIDESYIRIDAGSFDKAEKVAEDIRTELKKKFGITCSVGVGPNKLVAKIASDMDKPDGTTVVRPERIENFMYSLELEEIHGIGDRTVQKLEEIGIGTVKQLADADPLLLIEEFGGNLGPKLKRKAQGKDDSKVKEEMKEQLAKIVTLEQNSRSFNHIKGHFPEIMDKLVERLEKRNVSFGRVALIIVDSELERYSRSKTLKSHVYDRQKIREVGKGLLEEFLENFDGEIRRVGLRVGNLKESKGQKALVDF
jgi:DNA polymerase IV (DinB-like DNA polymerase)